jgi:hypothetical protein
MLRTSLACLTLFVLLAGAPPARGDERILDFLHGLRARDDFDLAILFLEQLEKRDNLPTELRTVLPYEKAVTFLESVKTERSPDKQSKNLDSARGFLEEFLKANPDHALSAQANSELANVYLGKARVEIIQSRNPNNSASKPASQEKARGYLGEARKVFKAANDKYEAQYKGFPVFIDPEKDKPQFEEREKSLVNFIQAQLNLGITRYEEAQTYDRDNPKFAEILLAASGEFEAIHTRYRSQVAGLYGRMWQGKCFEEMGGDRITPALGIYNELLGHPGESPVMKRLQNKVLHFKLICLNTDQRHDYQVVVDNAQEWLKENTRLQRTREGLGIRWEAARACEKLADAEGITPGDKEKLLRQALSYSEYINKFPGEYKDPSLAMIQRLNAKLNRDGDPQDFATAFGLSRGLVTQSSTKKKDVENAVGPARQKADEELRRHAAEMVRMLKLSLKLWTPKEDINELNRARYWLAYAYYLQKDRNLEAAVLGEFVATKFHKDNPDLALDAAFIAMYSYIQAYSAAPETQKAFNVEQTIRVCDFITKTWPATDKSQDARLTLGQLYIRLKRPTDAFKVLGEVPETATQYLEAQLNAGMAYWQAYIDGATAPEAERPTKETLDNYQAEARRILETAVQRLDEKKAKDQPSDENVSFAKTSLVQILNLSGKYPEALAYLVEGPKALVAAVSVKDEATRPAKGIASRPVAEHVHRELLRSYVGLQQLEKARSAMKDLERIASAGGGTAADVVKIYLDLGRELKKEVEQLQGAKDPRLNDVLKSFEVFLDDLFQRKDGQDYNTLSWIGETYFALGDGLASGDKARADGYFTRATGAFTEILKRAGTEPAFLPVGADTGVKLRMVSCKRRQGAFEEAIQMARDVLTAKPRALDAQREAALTFEDWAASGDADKWLFAIDGDKAASKVKGSPKVPRVIWGWFDLGERLSVNLLGAKPSADLERDYLDARLHVATSRYKYAQTQSGKPKEDALAQARRDIVVTSSMSDFLDDEWFGKFNTLFRDIQTTQMTELIKMDGEAVVEVKDLNRGRKAAPAAAPKTESPEAAPKVAKATKPKAKAAKKAPPKSDNTLLYAGVVVLLLAGGAGYFVMQSKGKGKPKGKTAPVEKEPTTASTSAPAATATPKKRPPAPKPKA